MTILSMKCSSYVGCPPSGAKKMVKQGGHQGILLFLSLLIFFTSLAHTILSIYLMILAQSNFDHYARECQFGILKKKIEYYPILVYFG